jgi:hypothetical protein
MEVSNGKSTFRQGNTKMRSIEQRKLKRVKMSMVGIKRKKRIKQKKVRII